MFVRALRPPQRTLPLSSSVPDDSLLHTSMRQKAPHLPKRTPFTSYTSRSPPQNAYQLPLPLPSPTRSCHLAAPVSTIPNARPLLTQRAPRTHTNSYILSLAPLPRSPSVHAASCIHTCPPENTTSLAVHLHPRLGIPTLLAQHALEASVHLY